MELDGNEVIDNEELENENHAHADGMISEFLIELCYGRVLYEQYDYYSKSWHEFLPFSI